MAFELGDVVHFHHNPPVPPGTLATRLIWVIERAVLNRLLSQPEHGHLMQCMMIALEQLNFQLGPNEYIQEPMFWSMVIQAFLTSMGQDLNYAFDWMGG